MPQVLGLEVVVARERDRFHDAVVDGGAPNAVGS
jgi:hypothetical protein